MAGRRIGKKAFFVGGVGPRARHNLGAVARPDLVLIGIDQRIQSSRIHQALFYQQRFERLDAQADVGRNQLVLMILRLVRGMPLGLA